MTTVSVSPRGTKKLLVNNFELYKNDFEDSLKGLTPGQWCQFQLNKNSKLFWGYINPFVEDNRPCAYIIEEYKEDIEDPWTYIESNLNRAINKRMEWEEYQDNSRLVYGAKDKLPGLIVDSYKNSVIIQINTAGIDTFRDKILNFLKNKYPAKECVLLDNPIYRKGEVLPEFESTSHNLNKLEINENNLKFEIDWSKKQKVGYYYDHRINRKKAAEICKNLKRDRLKGLDLFCYVGAWGLNLLNSNIKYVDFVDQGDFQAEIETNLRLNGFSGQGFFHRANVFEYLKENKDERFDVICSDPPAFCKSAKEKRRAIDGYIKLHRYCLGMLNKKSIFIACSCTHYVNHQEFQQTVEQAAKQVDRKIQLIDVGMQGWDHPITNLENKESYLKYYAYYVE